VEGAEVEVLEMGMEGEIMADLGLLKDTEMIIEMIGIGEDLHQGEEGMMALEVLHTGAI